MVELLPSKQAVAGSSPVSRFELQSPHQRPWFAGIGLSGAHSSAAERPAHNRLVAGSNPAGPTSAVTVGERGAESAKPVVVR